MNIIAKNAQPILDGTEKVICGQNMRLLRMSWLSEPFKIGRLEGYSANKTRDARYCGD